MQKQESEVQPLDRPTAPTAIVATAQPTFWDLDPAQLVEMVVRSVEAVLGQLTDSVREAVAEELAAWRSWAAGRLSDGRLRLSAQIVREALEAGGRHDLSAACVAVAAQTVDTVAQINGAETDTRRRSLLWSARMSAERAVHATELIRPVS
jgi:hypothetical protein